MKSPNKEFGIRVMREMWLSPDKTADTAVGLHANLNTILRSLSVIWKIAKTSGRQGMKAD